MLGKEPTFACDYVHDDHGKVHDGSNVEQNDEVSYDDW